MKSGSICTPIVLAGVTLLVATTSARAQFPTAKCVAAKIKCANGKTTGLLGCHNKAEGKNLPVDPACLSKVDTKFSAPLKGCMEKAEAKPPCATTADAAAIEAKVDAFVLDTVTALDPGYPAPVLNKCSAGKKKCVANGVKAILGCWGKETTNPNTVTLNDCINKALIKLDGGADPAKGCFAKLEAKPGCLTTGDISALENKIGAFSVDVYNELDPDPAGPTLLDYTTQPTPSSCGDTRDASNVVIKTLACGGLDLGGGASIIPEGPTPDGETFRFKLSCGAHTTSCAVGATTTSPAVNTADPDCTTTGCFYGAPLPIPNPIAGGSLTTCVLNTWAAPAIGQLDTVFGATSINAPLTSDTYITGNLAQPCPRCSGFGIPGSPGTGTCDRGPRAGLACTTTSINGLTRDCPTGGADGTHPCTPGGGNCIDGSHVGPIAVNLSPLTTGTANKTSATGLFCPGQGPAAGPGHLAGCFGSTACTSITENGVPYFGIPTGSPVPATLASVFCVASTGNGLVDASADLPGPGAVSLPGVMLAH
jgi:hypothetical protein